MRWLVAAAATVCTILTLWMILWTPPVEPATTPAEPGGVDVAERVAAAVAADRSTRDPLPEVSPLTTPEPPPPPEPEPVHVTAEPADVVPATGGLPSLLVTIRAHESGGDYTAYNPTGCEGYGCGGAYQLHAQYAAGWAAEAGYPGLSSQAQTWPPGVQDAVALYKFNATGGALWCDWADYC